MTESFQTPALSKPPMSKSATAFRTISEVSDDLDVPQHVLRFWETKFTQIKPLKRAGGRRYYRPEDILLLRRIRDLLHGEGYTIKGVQRLLKDRGAREALTASGAIEEPGLAPRPAADHGGHAQPAAEASPAPTPVRLKSEIEAILGELKSLRAMLASSRR